VILWSGYIKTDKNVSLGSVFVNFENSGLLGGWGMSELGGWDYGGIVHRSELIILLGEFLVVLF